MTPIRVQIRGWRNSVFKFIKKKKKKKENKKKASHALNPHNAVYLILKKNIPGYSL